MNFPWQYEIAESTCLMIIAASCSVKLLLFVISSNNSPPVHILVVTVSIKVDLLCDKVISPFVLKDFIQSYNVWMVKLS